MEPHHQDQLDPEFFKWRAQTPAKAIIPPVLLEPALKTKTSQQWAEANAILQLCFCQWSGYHHSQAHHPLNLGLGDIDPLSPFGAANCVVAGHVAYGLHRAASE